MLAEKPLISEETDLLEPTLLDELICHISSLASVYHKPPNAFVESKVASARRALPLSAARAAGSGGDGDDEDESGGGAGAGAGAHHHQAAGGKQPTVIPGGDLLGDLLDIGGFSPQPLPSYQPTGTVLPSAGFDLLGDGLDSLIGGGLGDPAPSSHQPSAAAAAPMAGMPVN